MPAFSLPDPATTEGSPSGGFLRHARLEVMPFASVWDQLEALDRPYAFTVTCSPKHGVDHTVDFAVRLAGRGHYVVPHISAKLVRSSSHLSEMLGRLAQAGIDDVFVIGGDAPAPLGPYPSAVELVSDLDTVPHRPTHVGIAAYPEGHPNVGAPRLMQALIEKQAVATYMTTQLCFSASALQSWIKDVRAASIHLPLHLGIPGAVQRKTLLEISMRVGVGGSIKYLAKNAGILKGLAGHRAYEPAKLIDSLAPLIGDPAAGIRGAHLFTFNQVTRTHAWLQAQPDLPSAAGEHSDRATGHEGSAARRLSPRPSAVRQPARRDAPGLPDSARP